MEKQLRKAFRILQCEWDTLDFTFHEYQENGQRYLMNSWPGKTTEDVKICVYTGHTIHEPFHRQDFFFLNYAYKNRYASQHDAQGNLTVIEEGDCYIGQPYNGYSLQATEPDDVTIIGVLIQRHSFLRDYLPTLAADNAMFRFFLEPESNRFADHFLHLHLAKYSAIRTLLEMMVREYANRQEDTQNILKPLILALFMLLARHYRESKPAPEKPLRPAEQILQYLSDHPEVTRLKEVAQHFSYHPNYVSSLLHQETGHTFSQILLEKRMTRAQILLKQKDLSVEDIAFMLGYSNQSNFYKAYRAYYGKTPRQT